MFEKKETKTSDARGAADTRFAGAQAELPTASDNSHTQYPESLIAAANEQGWQRYRDCRLRSFETDR